MGCCVSVLITTAFVAFRRVLMRNLDTLDLAKLEAGKVEMECIEFSLVSALLLCLDCADLPSRLVCVALCTLCTHACYVDAREATGLLVHHPPRICPQNSSRQPHHSVLPLCSVLTSLTMLFGRSPRSCCLSISIDARSALCCPRLHALRAAYPRRSLWAPALHRRNELISFCT